VNIMVIGDAEAMLYDEICIFSAVKSRGFGT
jgi:hypothetical protein